MILGAAKKWTLAAALAAALVAAAMVALNRRGEQAGAGLASGNGRIEATQYDIATKRAGRIGEVLVAEGDLVEAGQIVARMEVKDLQAELRQAEAQLRQWPEEQKYGLSVIKQREADILQAAAMIAKRESELALAQTDFERSQMLLNKELIARREFEQAQTKKQMAEAALAQEQAKKLAAEAGLKVAQIQMAQRQAAIDAALASIRRIKSEIDGASLKSPIRGRVVNRLAESGELLAAGSAVLTVLDLTDVSMTIFLPAENSAPASVGTEARIVLEAAPQDAMPATVFSVSPIAQITAQKSAARVGREQPVLAIKLKIDPEVLETRLAKIQNGSPGVAYLRLDTRADWPADLQAKLPP